MFLGLGRIWTTSDRVEINKYIVACVLPSSCVARIEQYCRQLPKTHHEAPTDYHQSTLAEHVLYKLSVPLVGICMHQRLRKG